MWSIRRPVSTHAVRREVRSVKSEPSFPHAERKGVRFCFPAFRRTCTLSSTFAFQHGSRTERSSAAMANERPFSSGMRPQLVPFVPWFQRYAKLKMNQRKQTGNGKKNLACKDELTQCIVKVLYILVNGKDPEDTSLGSSHPAKNFDKHLAVDAHVKWIAEGVSHNLIAKVVW